MSLMHRDSEATSVAMDGASGRPIEVRLGHDAWTVTSIEAVRDETYAYVMRTGPRTVFDVTCHRRRFRLVHLHRERRWTVEPLDPAAVGLVLAA